MALYKCKFKLGDAHMTCQIPSIAEVKDGFWINSSGDHTQISDALYWIPPGKVEWVEKLPGFSNEYKHHFALAKKRILALGDVVDCEYELDEYNNSCRYQVCGGSIDAIANVFYSTLPVNINMEGGIFVNKGLTMIRFDYEDVNNG